MNNLAKATANALSYSSMSRQKSSNLSDQKTLIASISKESVANKTAQTISASEDEDDEVDLTHSQDQHMSSLSKNPINVSSDEEKNEVRTRRAIRKKHSKFVANEKTDANSAEEIIHKSQIKTANVKKNDQKLSKKKDQLTSVLENDEDTDSSLVDPKDLTKPLLDFLVDKPKPKLKKTEVKYKTHKKKVAGSILKKRDLNPASIGSTKELCAEPLSKKVKTTMPYIDTTHNASVESINDPVVSAQTALFASPPVVIGPTPPITATTMIPTVDTSENNNSSTGTPAPVATANTTMPKNKKSFKQKRNVHLADIYQLTAPSLHPFLHLKHLSDGPNAVDTFIDYVILDLQPANVINRTPYLYQLWDPDHEFEIQMSQKNIEAQIDSRFTTHTEDLFKLLNTTTTRISLSLQLITISTPDSTSSDSISFLFIFASWMSQNFVHHEELLNILPVNTNNDNPFERIVMLVNKTVEIFNISDRLLAVTIDDGVGQFCTAEDIAKELSNAISDSANLQIHGIYSLSSLLNITARMFLNAIEGGQAWSAAMVYTRSMPTLSALDRLRVILHYFVSNSTDNHKDWECLFSFISDHRKKDWPLSHRKCIIPDSPLSTKSTYIMLRDAIALREIIDRAITLIPALQRYYITDEEWKQINDIHKLLHILYWCDSLVSGSPDIPSQPRFVLYILTLSKICEIVNGISENKETGFFENCDPNLKSVFLDAFNLPATMLLLEPQRWSVLGILASLLDPRQMDVVITDIFGPEKALECREVLDQFSEQYDNLSPVIDIDESDGEPEVFDVLGAVSTRAKKEASRKQKNQFQHDDLNNMADEKVSLEGKEITLESSGDPTESQLPRENNSTGDDSNDENASDVDSSGSGRKLSTQESESEDDLDFAALAEKLVLGVPVAQQKAQINDYFTEQLLSNTDLTDSELMLRWWTANGKSHLEYAAAARDLFGVAPSVEGIANRVLGSEFHTLLSDRIEHLSFPWLRKLVCLRAYTRDKFK